MSNPEMNDRLANYIRIHRRRTGLTQRELGEALGYPNENTIARHENFEVVPPLTTALAYEIVFRVPVSEIFAGLRDAVAEEVEARLMHLEERLGQNSARDRNALATARKLLWLSERKDKEYEPAA
jgi:DNA-binding XRE family transcriptional regulator